MRQRLIHGPAILNTVEAPVSGHSSLVSATGAGRLLAGMCKELEFKRGFVKAAVVELSAYESVRSESFDCVWLDIEAERFSME